MEMGEAMVWSQRQEQKKKFSTSRWTGGVSTRTGEYRYLGNWTTEKKYAEGMPVEAKRIGHESKTDKGSIDVGNV